MTLPTQTSPPRDETPFSEQPPAVQYLLTWIDNTGLYTVPNFDSPSDSLKNYDTILAYLCQQVGMQVSVEDFVRTAQEQFGIEPTEERLAQLALHTIELDGKPVISAGGKGTHWAGEAVSCTMDGDISTITIQFYADEAFFQPSYLVRYRVRGDNVFLGYEILSSAEAKPLNLDYGYFGEKVRLTGINALSDYAAAHPNLSYLTDHLLALLRCDKAVLAEHMYNNYHEGMLDGLENVRIDTEHCVVNLHPQNWYSTVKYDVVESSLPHLPTGSYEMVVADGPGGIYRTLAPNSTAVASTPATAVLATALSYLSEQPPAESDADPLTVVCLYGLYRNKPFDQADFPLADVQAYAETYLGVSGLIPPDIFLNDARDAYMFPGRGGSWTEYEVTEIAGDRANPAITVQFFADTAHLVPASTLRYDMQLIDGDYAIKNIKTLQQSKWAAGVGGI